MPSIKKHKDRLITNTQKKSKTIKRIGSFQFGGGIVAIGSYELQQALQGNPGPLSIVPEIKSGTGYDTFNNISELNKNYIILQNSKNTYSNIGYYFIKKPQGYKTGNPIDKPDVFIAVRVGSDFVIKPTKIQYGSYTYDTDLEKASSVLDKTGNIKPLSQLASTDATYSPVMSYTKEAIAKAEADEKARKKAEADAEKAKKKSKANAEKARKKVEADAEKERKKAEAEEEKREKAEAKLEKAKTKEKAKAEKTKKKHLEKTVASERKATEKEQKEAEKNIMRLNDAKQKLIKKKETLLNEYLKPIFNTKITPGEIDEKKKLFEVQKNLIEQEIEDIEQNIEKINSTKSPIVSSRLKPIETLDEESASSAESSEDDDSHISIAVVGDLEDVIKGYTRTELIHLLSTIYNYNEYIADNTQTIEKYFDISVDNDKWQFVGKVDNYKNTKFYLSNYITEKNHRFPIIHYDDGITPHNETIDNSIDEWVAYIENNKIDCANLSKDDDDAKFLKGLIDWFDTNYNRLF